MGRRWIGLVATMIVMTGCAAPTSSPTTGHPSTSPTPRSLAQRMLTADQLPPSLVGWSVAESAEDGVIIAVPDVTCSSLFADVTWLGVAAEARADSRISAPDNGDLSKWHGAETMAHYPGNAAQAMLAIRHVAGACTADPSPAGPGDNALLTAGPKVGDDSLELTIHLDTDDSYMGDDIVVVRAGQDLMVMRQEVLDYGKLDPATTRLLATAAYAAMADR